MWENNKTFVNLMHLWVINYQNFSKTKLYCQYTILLLPLIYYIIYYIHLNITYSWFNEQSSAGPNDYVLLTLLYQYKIGISETGFDFKIDVERETFAIYIFLFHVKQK